MDCNTGRSTIQVLLVDDEDEILALLEDTLSNFGYKVYTATSGERGLNQVREHHIDIVFSDLYMLDMTGVQFASALARMHPQIPIVMMTAFGEIESCKVALEVGASDYITKPIEVSTLPFIIENNLERKKIETQKLRNERADTLFKTIKAIASAIDTRSYYTGKHSACMADICMEIGREMGFASEDLNTLELASYIHDIGKIIVPDSVLNKPGELSEDEWAEVLRHPSFGADLLSGIDELVEVASIIRHHHEHVDGSGYPDGLMTEAIPILARILTVADAFEAMTSDRPYRAAISVDDTIKELVVNAGKQFDPAVVDAMTRVVKRLNIEESKKKAA